MIYGPSYDLRYVKYHIYPWRLTPMLIFYRRLRSPFLRRLFCIQLQTHACYNGCFWTAMEGVLTIGLSLSNAKRLRAVHGERNCLYLGSFVLYHSVSDNPRSPLATCSATNCFAWTTIWRYPILCDESFRPLRTWYYKLQTGISEILGIFYPLQRFLGHSPFK